MNPLITIILPTYRDAPLLESAITSVQKQTYLKWELIIVDDGLTDRPLLLVQKAIESDSRIKLIKNQTNLGIQKSLNRGIAEASGEYCARIDDDDIWTDQDKLVKQVTFLQDNPEYVLVGTNAQIVDEHGQSLGTYALPITDNDIRARMLSKNCFLHASIMARTLAIRQVGGYAETPEVRHIEDYDLWLKLGLVGKFANLSESMVRLTIHSGSMTFQNRLTQAKRMLTLIRRYRKKYPHFYMGSIILSIRIIGFMVLKWIPVPRKLVYAIQKLYKKY